MKTNENRRRTNSDEQLKKKLRVTRRSNSTTRAERNLRSSKISLRNETNPRVNKTMSINLNDIIIGDVNPTPSTSVDTTNVMDIEGTPEYDARLPFITNSFTLENAQTVLNDYLKNTTKSISNAYNLTHISGDSAVAFYHYVKYLISIDAHKSIETFNTICQIMYNNYYMWSTKLQILYELCINYNGYDATKEIMNIINQSVYGLVRFIAIEVYFRNPPRLFNSLVVKEDDMTNDQKSFLESIHDTIYNKNFNLTHYFNMSVQNLKYATSVYKNEKKTNNIELFKFKVSSTYEPKRFNFVIEK
ncbi:ORF_113 [Adoxophyes orana granulovirus]|uniref:ADOR114 n=1 Tax=Adoxophyes orana granulovirus TaxID=170617 RepID=Q7T9Q2_GVAO|nr:ORF_113 [Adoxophyes orana granulovirus]AAP85750.1 ORF_113 [Adoxophyes orana granulovirus]AJA91754.1 ADOR114 [Adoxophyes orana granulovirus]